MAVDAKKKVLFVCLGKLTNAKAVCFCDILIPSDKFVGFTGNICRSPAAEAVFKDLVDRTGASADFEIDSCGTGGGNPNWWVQKRA